jgi:hypothetical protein
MVDVVAALFGDGCGQSEKHKVERANVDLRIIFDRAEF